MNILTKQEATTKIISVLPLDIKILSQLFSDNGFKLFLVGGCVRDAFLNKNPKDFDVCTDASPEQIVSILKSGNITFQLQGEHFGVVVARMSEDIEIATFRTDSFRNHNIEEFIQYIKEMKPLNYEKRLNILSNMSNNKRK